MRYASRFAVTPRTTSPQTATDPAPGRAAGSLDVPRVIGDLPGAGDAPLLVCVAGIHGNEPSGVLALQRVFQVLVTERVVLRGGVVGFAGNLQALGRGVRYVQDDLNRAWTDERLQRVSRSGGPTDEDRELAELEVEIRQRLDRVTGPACLLDLHSTSGPGKPFITMDDTLRNRAFASAFPVPRVLGLEEELVGTLTGYVIRHRAMPALGFESGRHLDPTTREHAEAAVWIALEASGVLARGSRPEPAAARQLLTQRGGGLATVVEVRHRHEVGRDFRMEPGFSSFQPVRRGDVLAWEGERPVPSPWHALMLMPRYQGQGSDGFFLVRPVHPFWLALSSLLRRAGVVGAVHLLPGVTRDPDRPGSFRIDRRRARWLVRQVFHLLGFRREPGTGDETVMTPRDGGFGA